MRTNVGHLKDHMRSELQAIARNTCDAEGRRENLRWVALDVEALDKEEPLTCVEQLVVLRVAVFMLAMRVYASPRAFEVDLSTFLAMFATGEFIEQ